MYNKETVNNYINMMKELSMDKLIKSTIKKYIKQDSTILELGSASGVDYEELNKEYDITGSDISKDFINHLEKKYKKPFLNVDAANIKLKDTYDLIYSNKVLIHLNEEELKQSFISQYDTLNSEGYAIHTFWLGKSFDVHNGIKTYYYDIDKLKELTYKFEIIEIIKYTEFDVEDSVIVVLKK